ncbi:MAG: aminotransferase class III-fold pyridoxal phosphate-dependent enzyme [Nocardioides sp.]|jgi:acetylornithine/succinyldiaminopimelate/putrescine aminotransferase
MVMSVEVDTGQAALAALTPLRASGGDRRTTGLSDELIAQFGKRDPRLLAAVESAVATARTLDPAFLDQDEAEQVDWCQAGLHNFYDPDAVNPFVAAGAKGPWQVTLKGAVLYDTGGYGMLGWGHNPDFVIAALAHEQPMANVMTAHPAQRRFTDALMREIGQQDQCPYAGFMSLNSGSEAMSLACRIADTLSRTVVGPGGAREGATVKRLVQKGAFHGRTERPALLSDSSRSTYDERLASFATEDSVLVVESGDVAALESAFADAEQNGWFIELVALEPVMGEGNPGYQITREFYQAARRLATEHGSLLLIDSVQAGLRTKGVLSVVDYPEYAGCDAPDMESFSKAIQAGQYPLSTLALGPRAVAIYQRGTYGNTMTGNPRAMSIGATVLEHMTTELRANIVARGDELTAKLDALRDEFPGVAVGAQGTGLLVSLEIAGHKIYGTDSLEEWLRREGLGVIHGGASSLRFTPTFDCTSEELDLVVDLVRAGLRAGAGRTDDRTA